MQLLLSHDITFLWARLCSWISGYACSPLYCVLITKRINKMLNNENIYRKEKGMQGESAHFNMSNSSSNTRFCLPSSLNNIRYDAKAKRITEHCRRTGFDDSNNTSSNSLNNVDEIVTEIRVALLQLYYFYFVFANDVFNCVMPFACLLMMIFPSFFPFSFFPSRF